jgi:cephalosporin hydroxylase
MHVKWRIDQQINRAFLRRYYDDRSTWGDTYWLGIKTEKCPLDLWMYQEIIASTRPDLIIETGTQYGGSALFMASMCDMIGHGEVMTIDVNDRPDRPSHPRISYRQGSSTAADVVAEATGRASAADRVMVVLDSDHSKAHVVDELRSLSPLVTPGCYLIVEDTIINGNPVLDEFGPGPAEALEVYLAESPGLFIVDRKKERFHMSFNVGGYLRRVSERPTGEHTVMTGRVPAGRAGASTSTVAAQA